VDVRQAWGVTDSVPASPQLAHLRVGDCMHHGILSCAPDAPLSEVAGMMAKHRIHAVAVTERPGLRPLGIASDLDVVAAATTGDGLTARQAACTEPLTVSSDESLQRAAQLMTEHAVGHLVVVDAESGYPSGVLSTLDIAAVYSS
jgi:CBS domain-containing protein